MKFVSVKPEGAVMIDSELKKHNLIFVKFHVPTCPHCIAMKDTWESLNNHPRLKDKNVTLMDVDGMAVTDSKASCVRDLVGYPSIMQVSNKGEKMCEYEGDRSLEDILKFIVDKSGNSNKTNPNGSSSGMGSKTRKRKRRKNTKSGKDRGRGRSRGRSRGRGRGRSRS